LRRHPHHRHSERPTVLHSEYLFGVRQRTFLTNHADGIAAVDLFVVPTITFRLLYCLVVLRHGRRLWVSFGVTTNPTAEWIGTIRRECLGHMIVFGEARLRRILDKFAAYYNESRIHRSLDKDAPFHRAIERVGAITSQPVLGGLHHQYCRI
jgi:Integrase core domain